MGADYAPVLQRLGSERIVTKFALRFLEDKTFSGLCDALDAHDAEEAFRMAHTLKGICANLGFDQLFKSDQELTELLCGGDQTGWEPLFATVAADYEKLTEAIRQLAAEG